MKPPMFITGRMVLTWVLLFFGVIFMVNGVFVYYAMESWPGLSSQKAYEEGRDYNQTLSGMADQAKLGWTSDITFSADQGRSVFRVMMKDMDGQPLSGLELSASFSRPVGDDEVIRVALPEIAKGDYESVVTLPLTGRWYANVEAGSNEQVRYHMLYEVSVEP